MSFSESVIGAPEGRFILPTKVFPNVPQTFSTLPAFSPAAQLLEQPGDISFGKSSKLPRNRRATQNSPSSSTAAQGVGKLSTIEPLISPRTPSPTPVTRGTLSGCTEPEAFLSQNTFACSHFLGGLGAPPASLRGSLLPGHVAWSQRKLRRRRQYFANRGWRKS